MKQWKKRVKPNKNTAAVRSMRWRHCCFHVDDVSMTTTCVMVMFMNVLVPTSVAITIVVTTVTCTGLVATVINRWCPAVLRGRGCVIRRRVIWRRVRVYVIHDVITGGGTIVTCSGGCRWWWRHLTRNHLCGRSEVARVTIDMVGYYGTEPVTFTQTISVGKISK